MVASVAFGNDDLAGSDDQRHIFGLHARVLDSRCWNSEKEQVQNNKKILLKVKSLYSAIWLGAMHCEPVNLGHLPASCTTRKPSISLTGIPPRY